jgi:hypothetical protein
LSSEAHPETTPEESPEGSPELGTPYNGQTERHKDIEATTTSRDSSDSPPPAAKKANERLYPQLNGSHSDSEQKYEPSIVLSSVESSESESSEAESSDAASE